ncbi:cupin domain-containing protein [Occallatibacter riparius]|uniref:Uncharacterized protein n=1 Tax=Occallatibacter riparius TaxID=1002689 RepID=A0A9J7BW65_9BACT|nr:hypothetical protein [Occallatibacter riparius]UWZ86050.1 hypothetical protein MOP44_08905 [Occallatibacter riparius]
MEKMQPEQLLARLIHGSPDPAPPRRSESELAKVQHWTAPILLERCAYLRKMARAGEGWASDTIRDYPGHQATLVVRLRNSSAEMLDGVAQMIHVLEGRATIVTGGLIERPRKTAPGQTTGTAILGGSTQELRPGDVIHIAGGIPVQFHVPNEKPFSCLILQIKEEPTT